MSRNIPVRRRQAFELAGRVVERYHLSASRMAVLSMKEHDMLRIDVLQPSEPRASRFALRLYDPPALHRPSVITELSWLTALREQTSLIVPFPVADASGQRLVELVDNDGAGSRLGALFEWVEGRRRSSCLTPATMERVDEFVGHLHQHSSNFNPANGREAQRWDWDRVFGTGSVIAPGTDAAFLATEQREFFERLASELRQVMMDLGTGSDVWGLIHGDLHSSNYRFHRGEVRAIDFEDCGWGLYLFDLAVILDELLVSYPTIEPALRAALLKGYRRVRALSDTHERLLDLFIAMRLAELVRWHASHPDHEGAVAQLVEEAMSHLRKSVFSIPMS